MIDHKLEPEGSSPHVEYTSFQKHNRRQSIWMALTDRLNPSTANLVESKRLGVTMICRFLE